MLHDTTAFDICLDCPAVTPLIRRLLGPEGCLSTGTTRYREPVLGSPPPGCTRAEGGPWPAGEKIWWQLWHRCVPRHPPADDRVRSTPACLRCAREQGGACLPDHPLFIRTLQVTFELDDCDSTSHCLSIVPESLEEKQRLATAATVDVQVIRLTPGAWRLALGARLPADRQRWACRVGRIGRSWNHSRISRMQERGCGVTSTCATASTCTLPPEPR